LFILEDMGP